MMLRATVRRLLPVVLATLFVGCAPECGEGGEQEGGEGEDAGEERGPSDRLELHPEAVAGLRLEYAKAELTELSPALSVTAELRAPPDRTGVVGPLVAGRVRGVTVNVGDRVSKGAQLVTLDSPDVGQARAELTAAGARVEVAQKSRDRERNLLKGKATSKREVVEAEGLFRVEKAREQSLRGLLKALGAEPAGTGGRIVLRSPIEGTVVARSALAGQSVSPTDTLLEIVDLRELWLEADVYERDMHLVSVGQQVEIRVRAYPSEPFLGQVSQIGGTLDEQTRTVRARVVLDNEEGRLRPGMFAEARLQGAHRHAPRELLAIPSAAVQIVDDHPAVFVRLAEGEFELRRIHTGDRAVDSVEVLNGLSPGETVVTSGSFLLKGQLLKSELGEEE